MAKDVGGNSGGESVPDDSLFEGGTSDTLMPFDNLSSDDIMDGIIPGLLGGIQNIFNGLNTFKGEEKDLMALQIQNDIGTVITYLMLLAQRNSRIIYINNTATMLIRYSPSQENYQKLQILKDTVDISKSRSDLFWEL